MTDAEIRVTLPAQSRYVALARMTAAGLGADLEFNVDEIDELRVGADEVVALVIEWAEDHSVDTVELVYRIGDAHLELTVAADGHGDGDAGDPELDVLTARILEAVVDEHDLAPGRARIVKHRKPA